MLSLSFGSVENSKLTERKSDKVESLENHDMIYEKTEKLCTELLAAKFLLQF